MQINICDICKVTPKLPQGLCVSCAYSSEFKRRIVLEQHLFQLLELMRGCLNQIEAAVTLVRDGKMDMSDFATAMNEHSKLLPAPEEKKE